ncbi:MAG TPA: cytochrome C oxidase subunit IV family protein [Methylomirabilota bacterium]|jgi:cytochrome c oxidase subunit 4|nr:cytochrome C oxidase subunit IV family protein [Methylomirabilota bacterium]
MAEAHAHKTPNYMAIFFWLAVLTVMEIGAYFLPPPGKWVILVALALSKAALVAMYFMHLRFETRTLAYIALTPLAIGTLLILVLLPDHREVEHRTEDSAKIAAPSH